eukprot:9504049-Pyramimonas_sp.AAC.2
MPLGVQPRLQPGQGSRRVGPRFHLRSFHVNSCRLESPPPGAAARGDHCGGALHLLHCAEELWANNVRLVRQQSVLGRLELAVLVQIPHVVQLSILWLVLAPLWELSAALPPGGAPLPAGASAAARRAARHLSRDSLGEQASRNRRPTGTPTGSCGTTLPRPPRWQASGRRWSARASHRARRRTGEASSPGSLRCRWAALKRETPWPLLQPPGRVQPSKPSGQPLELPASTGQAVTRPATAPRRQQPRHPSRSGASALPAGRRRGTPTLPGRGSH